MTKIPETQDANDFMKFFMGYGFTFEEVASALAHPTDFFKKANRVGRQLLGELESAQFRASQQNLNPGKSVPTGIFLEKSVASETAASQADEVLAGIQDFLFRSIADNPEILPHLKEKLTTQAFSIPLDGLIEYFESRVPEDERPAPSISQARTPKAIFEEYKKFRGLYENLRTTIIKAMPHLDKKIDSLPPRTGNFSDANVQQAKPLPFKKNEIHNWTFLSDSKEFDLTNSTYLEVAIHLGLLQDFPLDFTFADFVELLQDYGFDPRSKEDSQTFEVGHEVGSVTIVAYKN